jgi:hypothetical protein
MTSTTEVKRPVKYIKSPSVISGYLLVMVIVCHSALTTLRYIRRLDDDCPVYTLHLVCRVPATKKETAVEEEQLQQQQLEAAGEGLQQQQHEELQNWTWYTHGLIPPHSSQMSQENIQQVGNI